MAVTPQITLTCSLLDFSGAQIGSAASPAFLRVALCGTGPYLPAITGTGMVGKVASWPGDLPYTGSQLSIHLWGNDVITPAGTYYAISVLDAGRNVIQTAAYRFTGTQTIDLSAAIPMPPLPISPTVQAGFVTVPFSTNPVFDCALLHAGIIAFEITLTGNVSGATLINPQPGQLVTFFIVQDGVGARSFAWPANVRNGTEVEAEASTLTIQTFQVRGNGLLYPIAPATVN